jgi:anti-anti-sigma regulatory factor
MLKKSPSGSLCPYYFMGGELHPLKYGSYFDKKEKLFSVIKAEEEFILKSSGQNNRRIWIDLYETNLDDDIIEALVLHLQAVRHKIYNLCLVGCSSKSERKIKKKMKQYGMDLYAATKYFSDPEIAKQWLIGKIKL